MKKYLKITQTAEGKATADKDADLLTSDEVQTWTRPENIEQVTVTKREWNVPGREPRTVVNVITSRGNTAYTFDKADDAAEFITAVTGGELSLKVGKDKPEKEKEPVTESLAGKQSSEVIKKEDEWDGREETKSAYVGQDTVNAAPGDENDNAVEGDGRNDGKKPGDANYVGGTEKKPVGRPATKK